MIDSQEVTIYTVLGIAGGVAGFIRFAHSPRVWKIRVVLSSCLMGAALSLMVVSLGFGALGRDVNKDFWKAFGISIGVGLFQPQMAPLWETLIKGVLSAGLKAVSGSTSRAEEDKE